MYPAGIIRSEKKGESHLNITSSEFLKILNKRVQMAKSAGGVWGKPWKNCPSQFSDKEMPNMPKVASSPLGQKKFEKIKGHRHRKPKINTIRIIRGLDRFENSSIINPGEIFLTQVG